MQGGSGHVKKIGVAIHNALCLRRLQTFVKLCYRVIISNVVQAIGWFPVQVAQSIVVFLEPVLGHGFCVVTRLTKCLPVALIPEQFLVTSMWDDVVDYGCFG